MTVLTHIGFDVDIKLITLITVTGRRAKLLELAEHHEGVVSVTHHHARGTDHSEQRPGRIQWSSRDIVMVLVESSHADALFALLFTAAELGEPHQGMIFMEPIARGHPMMPVAAAE